MYGYSYLTIDQNGDYWSKWWHWWTYVFGVDVRPVQCTLIYYNWIKMHSNTIKIIDAQQAKLHNAYKDTSIKLLKTNATICFNKMCKTRQLTPKYANMKINRNNRQTRNTKQAATRYRINQELKFLYCEKQQLSRKLYYTHLECTKYWNVTWHICKPPSMPN
jgi:hypothetical protein